MPFDINGEIDSCGNIYTHREFYITKSKIDSVHSGCFKGTLSKEEKNRLTELLNTCSLDRLECPKSKSVDLPVTTLIVYYNNKRKSLISDSIPDKADELIEFLYYIGTYKKLERTEEIRTLEF